MAGSAQGVYHLRLRPGDVGRYVLLPGDPGRVPMIAAQLDDPVEVACNREYRTFTGSLSGERVSVCSTGIGGPSSAIAIEELVKVGADTFVRVGTSGAMQPWTEPGDLAVLHAAIRDEGTSRQYLPLEFPAVAHPDVTHALDIGCRRIVPRTHVGIGQTKDAFFSEAEPARLPLASTLAQRWSAWVAGGAIASEMEAATQFIVASSLGVRAGAVVLIVGHHDHRPLSAEEESRTNLDALIRAAVEGLAMLIERDRARSGRA